MGWWPSFSHFLLLPCCPIFLPTNMAWTKRDIQGTFLPNHLGISKDKQILVEKNVKVRAFFSLSDAAAATQVLHRIQWTCRKCHLNLKVNSTFLWYRLVALSFKYSKWLDKVCRGSMKEHFYKMILKSDKHFHKYGLLKMCHFAPFLMQLGCHVFQPIYMAWTICVDSHPRNISTKLY